MVSKFNSTWFVPAGKISSQPVNPGGPVEPDDPIFLNVDRCGARPECKEGSKSILSKPKSPRLGGEAVGCQDRDEAIVLQAIDSLGRLDPEHAPAILIGRQ